MDGLFRFPDAVQRSSDVERWFERQSIGLRDCAERWFGAMRACGPDVRELLHDGWPTACADDAAFAYVAVYSAHVNVGFYRGAELPDPGRLLSGSGRRMRHVKLRPGEDVDDAALEALITAAYRDIKTRLGAP